MSGRKRHRITLQTALNTPDGYGDEVLSYETLSTPMAEIRMVSANERYGTAQVEAQVTHRILIWWNPLVATFTPKDRIVYGARIFDVLAVSDPIGTRREIEILAKENV